MNFTTKKMSRFLTLVQGIQTLMTGLSTSAGVDDANKLIATGSDGKIHSSLLPQTGLTLDVSRGFRVFEDFLMGTGSFSVFTSGSGASVSPVNSGTADFGGHPGICQISTGSTATGQARLGGANGDNMNRILFGYASWEFESLVQLPLLRTTTDEFTAQIGFTDNTAVASVVDGVFFFYSAASNFWQIRCSSNSVASTSTSSIEVIGGNWYKLKIKVNSQANSVEFFIDEISIGVITTNVPSGTGRQTGISLAMVKSAGTNNRLLLADYVDILCLIER